MSANAGGIPTGPVETEPIDYPTPGVFPLAAEREGILRDVLRTAGVELGAYDERIATWFAQTSDWSTFAVITSWVARTAQGQTEHPTDQAVLLSESERTMLTYALGQAQERMWSEGGFTDEDQAAVDSLRRLAAEEKSSRASADATPDKLASRERRLAQLLDTIRTRPGKWTTGLVQDIRRTTGGPVQRGTARRDLDELHRRGHLHKHGAGDGRYYTLRRRGSNG